MDELVLTNIADYLTDSDLPYFNMISLTWYLELKEYMQRRKQASVRYHGKIRYYPNGYSDNLEVSIVATSATWGIRFNHIPIEPDLVVVSDNDTILGFYKPSMDVYEWLKPIPELFYYYKDVVPSGSIFKDHEYTMSLCHLGIWSDVTRNIVKELKKHKATIHINVNDQYQVLSDGSILCSYKGRLRFSVGLCHVEYDTVSDELIYQTPDTVIIMGADFIYEVGTLTLVHPTVDIGSIEFEDLTVFFGTNKHGHLYITDIQWNDDE